MIEIEVRSNSYHFLSEATSYLASKISSVGFSVAVDFRLRPRIGRDIEAILNSGATSVILSTESVTFVSIEPSAGVERSEILKVDILLVMISGVEDFAFEVVKDDGSGKYETLSTMLDEAQLYLKSS